MRRILTTTTLFILLSFNTNAFFQRKDISGEYKGNQRMALKHLGVSFMKGCSYETWDALERYTTVGAGLTYLVNPVTGITTFIAAQVLFQATCFDWSVEKTKNFKIKLKASVKKTSSNRISVILSSQDKKKCAGFTMKLIGETDGFGGYELYKNKESYLNNEVFGTANFLDGKFDLSVNESLNLFTKGRKGFDCNWKLSHGLNVRFK